ncbi:MAG: 50S ribosomal protein L18 [bacterium]|nr:50S ribosomal protein L18 [bacterium]
MINKISRNSLRQKRHARLRRKLSGNAEVPRLSVFRSLRHIYVQLIDDVAGHTLLSASSLEKGFEENINMTEKAKKVGAVLAERMKEKGFDKLVFDRGGYKYHGRIAALADSLREAGIQF